MRNGEFLTGVLQEYSRIAKVARLITVEVGSLAFINLESFQNLYKALEAPTAKDCRKLEAVVKRPPSFTHTQSGVRETGGNSPSP